MRVGSEQLLAARMELLRLPDHERQLMEHQIRSPAGIVWRSRDRLVGLVRPMESRRTGRAKRTPHHILELRLRQWLKTERHRVTGVACFFEHSREGDQTQNRPRPRPGEDQSLWQTRRVDIQHVDPRDTSWEIRAPSYRVYFRRQLMLPNVSSVDAGEEADEYEISGATDVREVLAWAEEIATPDTSYIVYGLVDPGTAPPGLIRLAEVESVSNR